MEINHLLINEFDSAQMYDIYARLYILHKISKKRNYLLEIII